MPPRARRSSSATSTRRRARRRPTSSADSSCQVDVTDEAAVNNLFDTAADTYGSVDIAFNNAGISPPDDDSIETTELPAWQTGAGRQPQVGVPVLPGGAAPHGASEEGLDHQHRLVRRGDGLGDVADLLHRLEGRGAGDDARTRGAVRAQGIRVNALCPGPVNTPLLQELFAKDPERAARRLVHVPMGRFAEPEELAAAVAFLASDDASFITGVDLPRRRRHQRPYVTPL